MRDYIREPGCLMTFLRHQLDDPVTEPCGRCVRCTGVSVGVAPDGEMVARARAFLRLAVGQHRAPQAGRAGCRTGRGRAGARAVRRRRVGRGGHGRPGRGPLPRRAGRGAGSAGGGVVTRAGAGMGHVRAVAAVARAGPVARGAAGGTSSGCRSGRSCARRGRRPRRQRCATARSSRPTSAARSRSTARRSAGPVLLVDDLVDSRWTLTEVAGVAPAGGQRRRVPGRPGQRHPN